MPDHQTSPVGEDAERATPRLLPCPFCGGAAYVQSGSGWHGAGCNTINAGVICPGYCQARQHQTAAGAWTAWNRRAAAAPDASGLPRVKTWQERCDWWSDRSSTKLMVEAMKGEIADLRAQLASERQAKEYEQRHAVESEAALAQVQAELVAARQIGKHLFDAVADGAAPTQPKAQVGSIEDYAQFHHLLDSWMGLSGEHQNDAAPQVAEAWRKFIDYIDAWAGSRAVDAAPDGWRLAPEQPTNKMTAIGQDLRYKSVNSIGAIYRAMLAAAPAPGKQAGNDQDNSA